jgi:hypothetical protein
MEYNKKSQASLEFLQTYGLAILSAVICIGILAYFGVFSPDKYFQDCLKNYSIKYCNDNNMTFSNFEGSNFNNEYKFDCYSNDNVYRKNGKIMTYSHTLKGRVS